MSCCSPGSKKSPHQHFSDKDPIEHVVEMRAQGVADLAESHGTEIPGHISAGADAAREMAIALLLFWTIGTTLGVPTLKLYLALGVFGIAWLVWKLGRSAWLGWSRLERLHRVIEQEKWEIEHHRSQEREELAALYAAKGFEGKLLEEVVDVLMADGDRLLRVMLEEELGLALEVYEHPLKQAVGALIGAAVGLVICAVTTLFIPYVGMIVGAFLTLILAGTISALREGNQVVRALVWNVALGALALGVGYFTLEFVERIMG